jgi:signal transduction histidine kinase
MMPPRSTRDEQQSRESFERDRNTFLAMVSHELRTPTTSILGWATLIREGGIHGETLEHAIQVIERNARLQKQLIEQLLDFSRINQGCLKLDAQKASLVPIIEAAVDTMLPLAKAKEIDLQVYLDASTSALMGDEARLQQVLTNLLANAIKFTPFGGSVSVRLEHYESHAEVRVSDTGQGIASEFLPHIFDPFWQASINKATPYNGLGLGLAIARQIVERHNGKIFAESPGEGKGTTFTIMLPLADEAVATNTQA